MKFRKKNLPAIRGFTLVELLIVIAIIAILSVLSTIGASKFIESGRKVQALAQFRDFHVGLTLFETDYKRPPIPRTKRETGWDTIYGDPGGNYTNQFLVSALAGDDKDYPYKGENFSTAEVNPRGESYMSFPLAPYNKQGVGTDGKKAKVRPTHPALFHSPDRMMSFPGEPPSPLRLFPRLIISKTIPETLEKKP